MKVFRLTGDGLAALEQALYAIKESPDGALPSELLTGAGMVEPVNATLEVLKFSNRFSFAAHIDELMQLPEIRPLQRDAGLWGWLTLLFFDQVCPPGPGGRRKLGALPRYLPRFDSWRHYYRHLLAGPWFIFAAHRDSPYRAMALLTGPLDAPGDVVEQLASRQEIVTCPSVMEAITTMYFNRKTGKLRRGVASKGLGSARRLPVVLRQFDLTWDFFSMSGADVLELLPPEFQRFSSAES